MINAIAIDDEPPALKVIEELSKEIDFLTLQRTFTNPVEALKYLRKFPTDLLFLDINMPSISGLKFYKEVGQDTMVIFTTAHNEYAVEGFNLSAVDYLLKPFTPERFSQAVTKAHDYFNYLRHNIIAPVQHLFIRADYKLIKINIADILFVEGMDDYLKIHLPGGTPIVARMSMKSVLEKLPSKEFVRVHRSFIVPLKRIESIRKKMITISGVEIPVGQSYEESFFSIFKA